jgi:hypothetical protein
MIKELLELKEKKLEKYKKALEEIFGAPGSGRHAEGESENNDSNLSIADHEKAINELRRQKNKNMQNAAKTQTQRDPKYRKKQEQLNKEIRKHMDAIDEKKKNAEKK